MQAFIRKSIVVLSVGAVMVPTFAYAQSARDLDNRMQRIENEINTLSRAIYRGETPPPPSGNFGTSNAVQAQTEVRIQQMESDLRSLRGQIEEQNFEIRQLKQQMQRLNEDVDMRLGDLEGQADNANAMNANNAGSGRIPYSTRDTDNSLQPQDDAAANTADRPVGTLGTLNQNANGVQNTNASQNDSFLAGKNPSSQYENAFSLLKASNYDAAEKEFSKFLSTYPDHMLAGNAKYWLGETYYVRGNYEQAARVFAEGYQQYPDGSKAPDNLLKLGMALAGTGNTNDACVALRQLKKQYAEGAGPVQRRADQEISKLGC